MTLDAEVDRDPVGFVARIDAVATQKCVERAALSVDRRRVPDGDRADDADALRSERRPHGRPRSRSLPQPLTDSANTQFAHRSARRVIAGAMISTDETRMTPAPTDGLFRNG